MFTLLKPAPHLPLIEDPIQVEKAYKYWRLRIFYSVYLGYTLYYFTRKSFTFVTPYLITDLGFSKGDIGWLVTISAITYGVSKFTSGILCDRSNPRYFMAIGLLLTGIFNLLFGFSSSFLLLLLFWGLNGWFQGWGWPPCTKQLTYWFSRKERGTWWSACATSHTMGGFLIAYLAAFCAQIWGWRTGMFVPALFCIVGGVILLERLRDVPQSLGLPPIEKFKGEALEPEDMNEEPLSVKRILFEQVLKNKYVWVLSFSSFFVYVVRIAVNDWGTLYLVETKGYSLIKAASCVSLFEIGGFLGILVGGFGSDRWFQGRRAPFMVLCSAGLMFAVLGFWYIAPGQFILSCVLTTLIGFLVFGPQMLLGLAASEMVSKKAASTSNGFTGCFSYLGAAVAGYPLGKITEVWGWWGFIATLVFCSAAMLVILLPMWSIKTPAIFTKGLEPATA